MTWLIWRQQRRQAFVAMIALGAGVTLVVTGFGMLATYHSALRTCAAGLGGCSNLDGQVFQGGYNRFFDLVDAVGFMLPIVLAIFWGAPWWRAKWKRAATGWPGRKASPGSAGSA